MKKIRQIQTTSSRKTCLGEGFNLYTNRFYHIEILLKVNNCGQWDSVVAFTPYYSAETKENLNPAGY
jgi:hypothetical protein